MANLGPTWVLSVPDGPHVGPMKVAIRVGMNQQLHKTLYNGCNYLLMLESSYSRLVKKKVPAI